MNSKTLFGLILSLTLILALMSGCGPNSAAKHDHASPPTREPVGGEGPPPTTEPGLQVQKALYVANELGFSVSVVDLAQNKVVHNIKVGAKPLGLVIDSKRQFAYVANSLSNDVTVINLAENRPVAAISVGTGPNGLLITPDDRYLLVSNSGTNDISIIDLKLQSVVKNIEVGNLPMNMVAVPNSTKVWVCDYVGKSLTLLDYREQKVEKTLPVTAGPVSLALLPGSQQGVWGGHDNNDLHIVDLTSAAAPAKELDRIAQVGSMPITVVAKGGELYTVSHGSDQLFLVSPKEKKILKELKVGKNPNYLTFAGDQPLIYVSNHDSNDISVVDGRTWEVVQTIKVGAGPMGLEVR